MRRIITICALCATAFAGASALAMPLGVRTLLHAHAAVRQADTPPHTQPDTPQLGWQENDGWTLQADGSWKSPATSDNSASSVSMAANGIGTVTFRWKTSCEDYFNFKGTLLRQDVLVFLIDGVEMAVSNGIMSDWSECSFTVDGAGSHTFMWSYVKDPSGADGEDCAWLDDVVWTPAGTADGAVVEVGGAAVDFEPAADGKTQTATVADGTTAEDVKVLVGGVDVTRGFRVVIKGRTATIALMNPYEVGRDESAAAEPWSDNGDGTVTLNVEIVPGLYYAAVSAAMLEGLKCPGADSPARPGDALSVPKQAGAAGFYRVWVADKPLGSDM